MDWTQTRDDLLGATPDSPLALSVITRPGVYAWWDLEGALTSFWPVAFPPVDTAVPLYVGIAAKQNLSARVGDMHLANTRRSGLRRSLAPLLSESLDLMRGAVRHPRGGKFGLERAQEASLTNWMLANLRMTWVVHAESGAVEKSILRDLRPPLNDVHATGSPYRVPMRALRAAFRASAPLAWSPSAGRSV
jgi:hypothetical protein